VTHGLDTSFFLAVEIVEHAHHADALRLLTELLAQGDRMAIAPQVLAEFVHVVTDERRFQQPFSMETALNKSEHWWNAAEVDQVLPTDVAIALFHTWMRRHRLGRKRVLDTLLAADVTSLLTLNATDFAIFDELACVPIPALRDL
jgi:predicted nucleic acid-binding protein